MAGTKNTALRQQLTSILPPARIRRLARATGAVQRRRKIDIVALVYTLVLGFDRGARRSLANLRRTYAVSTGTALAPSAFYDRFTPPLAELMRQLTGSALKQLSRGASRMQRALSAFAKVYIADGSLVRLHDALQDQYPSVWTNHTKASAKLHVVMDGASRTPEIVRIVPGSRHDLTLLSVGPWCRGALLLFDLAYYQGKLFRQILTHGGHFLCRIKKDANFRILAAEKSRWVGCKHKQILPKMRGKSFEVQVDYAYRHIPERDWQWRHINLRLIAIWRSDVRRHRLYLTSATPTQLPARTAPAIYAMRWEIELLFRELKRQLRLEDMPSGNQAVTECLLYAALLALMLGRALHRALHSTTRRAGGNFHVGPPERWTTLLRSVMPHLLELLLSPAAQRTRIERRLRMVLAREGPDPNRSRLLLVERARSGILATT